MNCDEIQDRILNGLPLTDEERRHTAEYADCAALQRILEAVTPRSTIRPSAGLRERILAAAEPAAERPAEPAHTRRTGRIVYNEPVDRAALTDLPEGIAWRDFSAPAPHRLVGIPAREAAMRVLQAMGSWDRQLLDDALHLYGPGSCELLQKRYKGLSVVSVKEEVRSGNYAGGFVPCEVLLADGSAQTLMLALRRDNPEKAWLVDGGL